MVVAIGHLLYKPSLPSAFSGFSSDRPFLTIDGITVATDEEAEFLLSRMQIGDTLRVGTESGGHPVINDVIAVPYYSFVEVLVSIAVSLFLLIIGIVVYSFQPGRQANIVFGIASATLAAAILGTKTLCLMQPVPLGLSLGAAFFLAYSVIPVLFLHFALLFPAERSSYLRKVIPLLYLAAIAIAAWQIRVYGEAAITGSIDRFRDSIHAANWLNGFVVLIIVVGLTNLVRSYRRATTIPERQKLRWILYGLTIGTTPFVFFWALPQALGYSPWIPELLFKILLLTIPATFAISIVKYRVMDIDLVINRSVVYSIVIALVLLIYAGCVGLVAGIASTWSAQISLTVSTLAAIVIALLFEPLRKRVQHRVDKSFFRVTYDFRTSLRSFTEGLKTCVNEAEIARLLIGHIDSVVPVNRAGYFTLTGSGDRLRMLSHTGYDLLVSHGVRIDAARITSSLQLPLALNGAVEPTVQCEQADEVLFRRWGMALVVPLKSKTASILGFLVLGEKKSGSMFTSEDIDLLAAISAGAAAEIERLQLQQKVLFEHEEARRLEELSAAKSYFVSSVSHDLKTPLTSIALFAELLQRGHTLPPEEVREYLAIIEGESRRLTRLIDSVLDFSKIERGVKEYHPCEVELSSLVEQAMQSMRYQFTMAHAAVTARFSEEPLIVNADPDAVIEAVINLLSNALKYTGEEKRIEISTALGAGYAAVTIADNGRGIEREHLGRLFEPFFRAPSAGSQGAGGAGLGLSIVKHIMDSHRGRIDVASTPGAGSAFTLFFPAEG